MTAAGRILVFSPHPDDVELFMGGTLLKHVAEGAVVRVVMMTHGEKGSLLSVLGRARQERLKRVRDAELKQRYLHIPSVELSHLDLPDRGISESPNAVARALECVRDFAADLIYLPESNRSASLYTHPDHLATGLVAESAAARQGKKVTFRYYHSRQPNTLVDVSPFHEENLRGLRCYRTQYSWHTGIPFFLRHYEKVRNRRTRELGRQLGVEFAEAFRQVG